MQTLQNKDPKALMAQLRTYIKQPPENSRVFEFTPEMAMAVLAEFNNGNRSIKHTKVERFAAEMRDDNWLLTGDTIKFTDNGALGDGQHRLTACVRSGLTFRSHVVFGIEARCFHKMDRNTVRGPADVLQIAGLKNANHLAAALRWALLLDSNPCSRETFEPEVILNAVRGKFASVEASLPMGRIIAKTYAHPIGQMAGLHWAFAQATSTAVADEFFEAWANGEKKGRNLVIRRLQEALVQKTQAQDGRIHDVVRAAMIVKGWNLWRNGRVGTSTGKDFAWAPRDGDDQVNHFPVISK